MMDGSMITTNPLQIPSLFASDYETAVRLGFLLFSVMFTASILHENLQGIRGEADYIKLFIRVLLVAALLVFYERFFVWIVHSLRLLSESVFSRDEYERTLKSVFQALCDERDMGFFSFQSLLRGMNYVTYHVALALLSVLRWLQFVLLSALYILGPVLIGAGVYEATSQGLSFWLRSVVEVSSWQVILSIFLKVISTMNLTAIYNPEDTNTLAVFSANLLFIALFVLVPLISRQIVSRSGSLGGVGSIALGAVSAFLAKQLRSGGRR